MSQIFDLIELESYPYQQRDKNVLYHRPEFKVRIINLAAGEKIPQCRMEDLVVFVGIKGCAAVTIDGQQQEVDQGKCLVGGPGLFSMKSGAGARLLGIQVKPAGVDNSRSGSMHGGGQCSCKENQARMNTSDTSEKIKRLRQYRLKLKQELVQTEEMLQELE
ncbi:MAG: hypothetical protein K9H14_01925 [Actinomycetia bacterium]|nr:hypothetical protein [Actinomycetes bacterium]